jgi:hypothetical protein
MMILFGILTESDGFVEVCFVSATDLRPQLRGLRIHASRITVNSGVFDPFSNVR